MMKLVFAITILFVAGLLVAQGQQTEISGLSDTEKSDIIEAVIDLNLKDPTSRVVFAGIRTVSLENIEFIEPSRLRDRGFTFVSSWQLSLQNNDYAITYLVFKKIRLFDGVARVVVWHVTEYGRACFSDMRFPPTISIYTYECRRTPVGWIAQLIGRPSPLNAFATKRYATKR